MQVEAAARGGDDSSHGASFQWNTENSAIQLGSPAWFFDILTIRCGTCVEFGLVIEVWPTILL